MNQAVVDLGTAVGVTDFGRSFVPPPTPTTSGGCPVPARIDTAPCRILAAKSASDRASAERLIRSMYATRGYTASPLPSADCASSRTFLATESHNAVGTLTVCADSADGLMVDKLFPEEVERFRAAGLGVCEFTKLAMDRRARSPCLLAALFHVAYLVAHRVMDCRHLLVEVNPRHVRYYEAMLGFKVVGEPRHDARVGASAVLLALDLCHAQRRIAMFGGSPILALSERSAYPYFFDQDEESCMLDRLMLDEHGIASVSTPSGGSMTTNDRPQSAVQH